MQRNTLTRTLALSTVVLAGSIHASASADEEHGHADMSPYVVGGKIIVGAYIDGEGAGGEAQYVFGYELGESAIDPYNIGDPGFNAQSGSGLTPGSNLGVRVLSDLYYWDGAGDFALSATPEGESLMLLFGAQSRTVGTGTGELADLFFGPAVTGEGVFHAHLFSSLLGSDGNSIPGDGIEPAVGIYAVQLSVLSSDGVTADSDPVWLVYNNGLDEELHEAAMDALVPEPGSLALLGLGAAGLLRRRR